ncbi:ABC transporter permease [candidate division KSB1 bacterium]
MKKEKQNKYPKLESRILNIVLPEKDIESLNGDFLEIYIHYKEKHGLLRARLWLWKQILKSVPLFILNSVKWSFIMFSNYLKIAFRYMSRQKGYSLINILGLALGMACFILILLYVNFELSYDRYNTNADNIYRIVIRHGGTFMGTDKWVWTPAPMAPALKENFPEIIRAARVEDLQDAALKYKDRNFTESRFYLTDPEFLKMYILEFTAGNPETALDKPFSLLITEDMAEKYFKDEDPIGKTIRLNDMLDFSITGVIKNIPENSHLKYDFLSSFRTLESLIGERSLNSWGGSNYQTYVELSGNPNITELEKKFTECVTGYDSRYVNNLLLQPLTEIHLSGTLPGELDNNSEKKYIYIFSLIAVLILTIACFNYMNLSTARSAKRAMDVGVRKIIGATRRQLMNQYIGESLVFSTAAFLLSLLFTFLLLPLFNSVIGRDLQFTVFSNLKLFAGLIGITILTGLVSGSYPAIFISSFQPVKIIKGDHKTGSKGSLIFRNSLVLIQFIISIGLIVSTLIVFKQLNFIRTRDAGFEREHIITMKVNRYNKALGNNIEEFKNELLKNPEIAAVTRSNWPPTNIRAGSTPTWEEKSEENNPLFHNLVTDHDFLDLYGIKLIKGRNFSKEISTDLKEAYIINETAAEIIGVEDPVGLKFGYNWRPGKIIGVVKDFHFIPMTLRIIPLAIRLNLEERQWLSIRMDTENLKVTLSYIEETWKKFSPGFPFDYSFIDERFDALYKEDLRQGTSFGYFTFMAIFLACLGLFGLVSFTAEQKTREIGIRKVFGASVNSLITLITKEFLKWILLSSLIAVPVSWYAMNRWISNYAYRIDIGIGTFAAGVVLALVIALLSVSYQAYKAASANPVESLRNE